LPSITSLQSKEISGVRQRLAFCDELITPDKSNLCPHPQARAFQIDSDQSLRITKLVARSHQSSEAAQTYHQPQENVTPQTWSLEELTSAQVRVHTGLARQPEAKLWYYLRSLDPEGRGIVEAYLPEIKGLLKCSTSTVYRWLKEGKRKGFFRNYHRRGYRFTIHLGGLLKVSAQLNLEDWGVTARIPLGKEGYDCRHLATEISCQRLQQKSRFAAKLEADRGIPFANEILAGKGKIASCNDGGATNIPYLLKTTERMVMFSQSAKLFGASQLGVAKRLGISERSVRRHLSNRGVYYRQVCQTKPEYTVTIGDQDLAASEGEPNERGRYFQAWGRVWRKGCNLYALEHDLTSMKRRRRNYQELRKASHAISSSYRAVRGSGGGERNNLDLSINEAGQAKKPLSY